MKQRVYVMLGFERFGNAAVAVSGIELGHKIRKAQFNTSVLKVAGGKVSDVWEAVLAA